jgi:hypothetical protein
MTKVTDDWPPVDWTDDFRPPGIKCMKLTNACPNFVSSIDLTEPRAVQLLQRIGKQSLPVVFFASVRDAVTSDGKYKPHEWTLYPAPELPGRCMAVYVHQSTMELLDVVAQMRPAGSPDNQISLMWHTTPVVNAPHVFSPIEAYVLVGAQARMLASVDDASLSCANCAMLAQFKCRCESLAFCSLACEQAARAVGVHTEAHCAAQYTKRIADATHEARVDIARQLREEAATQAAEVEEAERRAAQQKDADKPADDAADLSAERKKYFAELAQLARIERGLEPDPDLPDVSHIVKAATESGFYKRKSDEPAAPAAPASD